METAITKHLRYLSQRHTKRQQKTYQQAKISKTMCLRCECIAIKTRKHKLPNLMLKGFPMVSNCRFKLSRSDLEASGTEELHYLSEVREQISVRFEPLVTRSMCADSIRFVVVLPCLLFYQVFCGAVVLMASKKFIFSIKTPRQDQDI